MKNLLNHNYAEFSISPDGKILYCKGNWTISGIEKIEAALIESINYYNHIITIDAKGIRQFDSTGALLLAKIHDRLRKKGPVTIIGLSAEFQPLLDLVKKELDKTKIPKEIKKYPNWFHIIGKIAINKYYEALNFLAFIGELWITFFNALKNPKRFQFRSIISTIEVAGYHALPIVGLMVFLIGIVLAYQLAAQLKVYGADIYVVDVAGIGLLREFAPLITAIILAGRTSTSFAALLGTMKVNEEIDALETMGVSSMERLVLPRIIGLVVALPLLVVWADIFGVLGAMVMTKNMLNIGYHAYLERFQYAVQLKQYVLGLVKTPIFAIIIASVGCFQGFQTSLSAESVGRQTTKAAVQAIFLIIIADAAFSVLFNQMGY